MVTKKESQFNKRKRGVSKDKIRAAAALDSTRKPAIRSALTSFWLRPKGPTSLEIHRVGGELVLPALVCQKATISFQVSAD